MKIKDTTFNRTVIHPNDTVQVTLTATGAETLNDLNRKANTGFLLRSTVRFRTDYTEGEVYRDQLWHIFKVFGDKLNLGLVAPFTDLWLDEGESEIIL